MYKRILLYCRYRNFIVLLMKLSLYIKEPKINARQFRNVVFFEISLDCGEIDLKVTPYEVVNPD